MRQGDEEDISSPVRDCRMVEWKCQVASVPPHKFDLVMSDQARNAETRIGERPLELNDKGLSFFVGRKEPISTVLR